MSVEELNANRQEILHYYQLDNRSLKNYGRLFPPTDERINISTQQLFDYVTKESPWLPYEPSIRNLALFALFIPSIRVGADINACDSEGKTALMYAVKQIGVMK